MLGKCKIAHRYKNQTRNLMCVLKKVVLSTLANVILNEELHLVENNSKNKLVLGSKEKKLFMLLL